jgi:Flp pilus assembly protein TadB
MDFWVAIISGGAAVLGATVGGLAAALPAWGAEKRAAETQRRSELRKALLEAIDAMDESWRATVDDDAAALRTSGSRFLQANATLGTLVKGKKDGESAIPAYMSTVLNLVVARHPESSMFVTQASVLLPAWFRGSITLEEIAKMNDDLDAARDLMESEQAAKSPSTQE